MNPIGGARKDWTVLYYLNGNSDLQPQLVKNLIEVERVGSSDRVDIVAQLSRAPKAEVLGKAASKTLKVDGDWVGMRRYHVQPGSGRSTVKTKPVESFESSPNHGDSATLRDFLRWGMDNYPAKRYMVVIGDHGKGFQGTGFDYAHKDVLDLDEMRRAFDQSGLKPDVLLMDACEMGSAEVAYQLRDQAKVLVASEEIIGSQGLPHFDFMSHLRDNPQSNGKQLAKAMVEISGNDTLDKVDRGKDPSAEQLAALDLGKLEPLADSLSDLGKALSASGLTKATLRELIEETQHFNLENGQDPDQDFRDLHHFCGQLVDNTEDKSVREAAQAVQKAMKSVVIANHGYGESIYEANGVSIYLPPHPIGVSKPIKAPNGGGTFAQSNYSYKQTDFDKATGWSKWLATKMA